MKYITDFEQEPNKFLSNFYQHNGWTVEHYYQAAKTDDPVWMAKILKAPTPAAAKKLGRLAPIRPNWENEKLTIMRILIKMKFRDPQLQNQLLATGDAYLIEGNWWGDRYWGQCQGTGQNWLGILLMNERDQQRAAL